MNEYQQLGVASATQSANEGGKRRAKADYLKPILLALSLIALVTVTASQTVTQKSVEKALSVIEAAVEAYGGEERLNNLGVIVTKYEDQNPASGQSRAPGPPWDINQSSGIAAIDIDKQRFATRNWGSGGGFDFSGGTVVDGEKGYQLDFRTGTATGIASPDFDTLTGPFARISPPLLVKLAHQRSYTAHYLGTAKINRKKHDVISFVMAVGPAISLYFDQRTKLLTKSERVLPGFGLVEYDFGDYQQIDGVPFNGTFALRVNNQPNMARTIKSTTLGEDIGPYLVIDKNLEELEAIGPDEFRREKLADGVYHIGGNGTYALFIEMKEYVVAVGGTAGIPDRIASLREVVPTKPVRYGVMTHHHSDHILALTPYAEEGATVIAASAHVESMRDSVDDSVKIKFEGVDGRKVVSDGTRELQIIDIGPTPHAEHFLLAYLPKENIVFEADHFSMPRVGPVRAAVPATIGFAKALKQHGIEPKLIASAHSPVPGTLENLQESLKTKPRDAKELELINSKALNMKVTF